MSSASRPGRTVSPGSSTSAVNGARTEISMSVAASSAGCSGDGARSEMPDRICTLERADTPRPTTWSFWRSSSRERLIFIGIVSLEGGPALLIVVERRKGSS